MTLHHSVAACAPEIDAEHVCTAVDGQIRIFLEDPASYNEALKLTEDAIVEAIASPDFVDRVGAGLMKIELLDDQISAAEDEAADSEQDPSLDGEGGFGTMSFVLLAVGSASLIAFVGSVYYWRNGGETDGNATEMAGTTTIFDSEAQRPPSPFSEMLPRAYRFNDSMSILTGHDGMSPVMEDEDSRSTTTPSVALSEGSFSVDTENDSTFDAAKRLYDSAKVVAESPVLLGARKRAGGQDTAGVHMSESGTVLSESDSCSSLAGDSPETAGTKKTSNLLTEKNARETSVEEEDEDDLMLFGKEKEQNSQLFGEDLEKQQEASQQDEQLLVDNEQQVQVEDMDETEEQENLPPIDYDEEAEETNPSTETNDDDLV